MPDDARELVAPSDFEGALPLVVASLPLSLQIFFDDSLFKRCQTIANYMADAGGFVAPHLKGNPKACFAVVSKALTWRLDPYAVAQATYATPGGSVGYFGSLCQAIIENSGRLEGGVRFEHYGEWRLLRGKFRIVTSDKGGKYPAQAWKPEDEDGLGVRVIAKVRGEAEPRQFDFDLVEAFPRNSTLWATSPRTQICYTAVRRFASACAPSLFMGVPFDREEAADWADALKDVTPREEAGPRPELEDYDRQGERPARSRRRRAAGAEKEAGDPPGEAQAQSGGEPTVFEFADHVGEIHSYPEAAAAIAAYAEMLDTIPNIAALDALIENASGLLTALAEAGRRDDAEMLAKLQLDARRELLGETGETDGPETQPTEAGSQQTTTEAQPDAAEADDLVIPLGDKTLQAWEREARSKLTEMINANRPTTEFQRFRAVNADALAQLKDKLRSYWTMLDKRIVAGERGPTAV